MIGLGGSGTALLGSAEDKKAHLQCSIVVSDMGHHVSGAKLSLYEVQLQELTTQWLFALHDLLLEEHQVWLQVYPQGITHNNHCNQQEQSPRRF
jgi:hypothetical protein